MTPAPIVAVTVGLGSAAAGHINHLIAQAETTGAPIPTVVDLVSSLGSVGALVYFVWEFAHGRLVHRSSAEAAEMALHAQEIARDAHDREEKYHDLVRDLLRR